MTIPVVEEQIGIDKQRVVTGKVNITITPTEEVIEQSVDLTTVSYREERKPIGSIISERPEIRQEGATTIIPVVVEEVVVTKRLRLVEEIHLIREENTVPHVERTNVRKDQVSIVRE